MHHHILTLAVLSLIGPHSDEPASNAGSSLPDTITSEQATIIRSPLPEVSVEIDVSALDRADARELEIHVRGRTELILDEHEYFLDDAAADSVVVRIGYGDVESLGYQVQIYVYDDGQLIAPGEERLVCDRCSPSRVAELYAARLPAALDRLATANATRAEQELVDDPPVEEFVLVEPEPRPAPASPMVHPTPRRERPLILRNAGLATLIPGSVALGAGIGMVLTGSQPVEREDDLQIEERHFRPPGIAVAAVGGVATMAGVAMLVRSARIGRIEQRGSERLGWAPMLGTRAGVVLLGKF